MLLPKSCVMMDVAGTELLADEVQMLKHPLIGGVILFTRNFENSEQLSRLISDIRNSTEQQLLIAVDHEGGRVQRFRSDGFTKLPAMGKLSKHKISGSDVTELGWLMASECLAHGIDLSFAPVLDLDRGSDVVGDRAFSSDIEETIELAGHWCSGMKQAGMACVGKHFPGHGSTKEDTHIAAPKDERELAEVMENDGEVFRRLTAQQTLDAVMPAHINFPNVDDSPVGYSKVWLQQILKKDLAFTGLVFSDDLSMVGAGEDLTYLQKAQLAMGAGCDMVLMCNNKAAVKELLNDSSLELADITSKSTQLCSKKSVNLDQLAKSDRWLKARTLAQNIILQDTTN